MTFLHLDLPGNISKRYADKPFFNIFAPDNTSGTVVQPDEKDELIFFPINNLDSNKDPFIKKLQVRITKMLYDASYVKQSVPRSWFSVFDQHAAAVFCAQAPPVPFVLQRPFA